MSRRSFFGVLAGLALAPVAAMKALVGRAHRPFYGFEARFSKEFEQSENPEVFTNLCNEPMGTLWVAKGQGPNDVEIKWLEPHWWSNCWVT